MGGFADILNKLKTGILGAGQTTQYNTPNGYGSFYQQTEPNLLDRVKSAITGQEFQKTPLPANAITPTPSPSPTLDQVVKTAQAPQDWNYGSVPEGEGFMPATGTPSPTAVPQMHQGRTTNWDEFVNAAREAATQRGYDPDTIIRQKALESDFGRSRFAQERNNYGGIGAYDSNPDSAFSFPDAQAYLDYYFKLIENRYPDAYANRKNPKKYVKGLKKGGYASDPDYEWKIANTPLQPR